MRTKTVVQTLLVVGVLVGGYFRFLHKWPTPPAGAPAPEIAAIDLDGRPMTLSEYRGKVVVLTFWGYWCGTCRAEIPFKKELATRFAGQPVVMLGVNSDGDREDAARRATADGLPWRSFWNDGRFAGIATDWGVRSWPATFILDRQGVVRYAKIKPPEIAARVAELVAETGG